MSIKTVTFDPEKWQLVPKELTNEMFDCLSGANRHWSLCADWNAILAVAPEPPAQPEAPTRDLLAEARDQVEALDRENHQMRRCVARLMARLTVWLDDDQFNEADGIVHPEFEPPAQQPMVDFDIAIAAGDGTLHGAIDHWQERALTAEAKLAAQQPREPDGYAYRYPDPTGIGRKGVIRFGTNGRSVNGSLPLESIPYWLGSPPPAQQPMTEDEIDEETRAATDALMDYIYEYGTGAEGSQQFIRRIARAVEAHHGIGKGESNAG